MTSFVISRWKPRYHPAAERVVLWISHEVRLEEGLEKDNKNHLHPGKDFPFQLCAFYVPSWFSGEYGPWKGSQAIPFGVHDIVDATTWITAGHSMAHQLVLNERSYNHYITTMNGTQILKCNSNWSGFVHQQGGTGTNNTKQIKQWPINYLSTSPYNHHTLAIKLTQIIANTL